MAEETFEIVYQTDVSGSKPGIDYLRSATISLGEFAFGAAEQIKRLGTAATTSAKNLTTLGQSIDQLTAKRAALVDLVLPFEFLDTALGAVRQGLAGANADLRGFADRSKDVGRVTFAMSGLADSSTRATTNVNAAGLAVGKLGADAGKLATVKAEMVGFQRSAYGAMKNVEETGQAVGTLNAKAAGLTQAGSGFAGFGKSVANFRGQVDQTTPSVGSLGSSMLALHARILVFNQLKEAVQALGGSITNARETTDKWAKGNLGLRDEYRELANLQGKAEPDDQVVGGALRFRIATGMKDQAANDVLRRFEGELPAATAAGNITGNATSGVAGDFLREATRTGLRVGMSGSTTGLLAAKLAMSEKIPDAATGVGKFQTVVDLLNRGSGDLTPLVQSTINTAGGNVGKGLAFKSIPQLAAAVEVASANATPAVAGTRVRQAVTGLNRLRLGTAEPDGEKPLTDDWASKLTDPERNQWIIEHYGEAKLKSLKRSSAADAKKGVRKEDDAENVFIRDEVRKSREKKPLVDLKLSQDDFAGNIEKLGSYLDTQKDKEAALIGLGLKNQTERRSLIQFSDNRQRLRTETTAADKGVDPAEAKRLNAQFFAGDTAQQRIAEAQNDASEFVRARDNEKLQVARKAAESRLKTRFQLDTASSNFEEALADNPITRAGATAALKAAGKQATVETLPLSLGGKPTRELKIDKEAFDAASSEARRVGFDPKAFLGRRLPDDAPFEDRFNTLATEVQRKGGNPFGGGPGGGQTDVLLQALIQEVKRGNEQAAANGKQAAQPGFLPQNNPNQRGFPN